MADREKLTVFLEQYSDTKAAEANLKKEIEKLKKKAGIDND